MKKWIVLPLFLLVILFGACEPGVRGKGDTMTETRNATNFHGLEISTAGRVDVRTDSVFSVEVTCEESILPYLETVVDDGILKIYFDRQVWDVDGLRIRVTAPYWDALELDGSANVLVPDAISGDDLNLKISGSGNVDIANADFLTTKIKVSGSGDVNLSGIGKDLDCSISGSGDVDALDFLVKTAKVSVSGSGNIRLQVSDSLDATVSGSGDVEYQGNPQVNSSVSGSGRVRKL